MNGRLTLRLGMALALALALLPSCATRRAGATFRVLPAHPEYLLRSPDSKETSFAEVLGGFTLVGPGWVDLHLSIELRVENAYFREGAPKHGLANFLGTEIARYRVLPSGGLQQIGLQSRVSHRPADQLPVQQLLRESQRRLAHHRFFYQILVSKKTDVRSAVLLSAASTEELDRLTEQLVSEPDLVCGDASTHCTAFPEACSVSLEIEVAVNGAPRRVPWGSTLSNVAERPGRVEMSRPYEGRLVPVKIDPRDPEALRVPLLPGDRIKLR